MCRLRFHSEAMPLTDARRDRILVAKRRQIVAAGVSPQSTVVRRPKPRSGDRSDIVNGYHFRRRFAAFGWVNRFICGLTPAATIYRRFATKTCPRNLSPNQGIWTRLPSHA